MLGKLSVAGLAGALLLAGCGGGGGGSNPFPPGGFNGSCDPGTSVSLANPSPNSYNVPTNIGNITIVANGNNNSLGNSYGNWNIILESNNSFGGGITGGNLSLVSDPSAPHPYPSDYYYQSSIQQLPSGVNWTVILANSGCNGVAVGSFST